ncbi:GSCOCG00004117001-RA-CDS [Cotesia congregata]|nr:GSCOCG00004117001-RA-CDS [Cotesia congregata]
MIASLSENSIKQYDVCLKKWFHYCQGKGIDLYEASVSEVLEFLTNLFKNGSQCGSLNSCRAALALVITEKISEDDRIRRFFKGVFRLRPPLPKYDVTWDTSIVLDALAKWYPNEELSLEELTRKCVTLLALGTAHRVQTLSKINIDNIEVKSEEILIKIPDMIKTSRIGAKQPLLSTFFQRKIGNLSRYGSDSLYSKNQGSAIYKRPFHQLQKAFWNSYHTDNKSLDKTNIKR